MKLYFKIYKPYGMLSQFTPEGNNKSLADLDYAFPRDVYPVGRLDADSEGLLILTNDTRVNSLLLDPTRKHLRTYLVQVEGNFSTEAAMKLESGVTISVAGKKYITKPCKVRRLTHIPDLPDRNPPVRYRKTVSDSWIEISLAEGKNRQVRKMTAACGFPTLRLVRIKIEELSLESMQPCEVKQIPASDFFKKTKIHA
ncbi:MAG: pseudouridine synthase [Bacteroidetes bacterium]|nr:MAG: pseudouridine synthase [Bacteroidota bacterium]REK06682.1 MAG: pseudouridine synthase [Bacteroidota bacterium]REK33447.1 MAG: pseudouridine synthase [Bacteroidota bacterium]REK49840.1 MAG: pseudouridine synthase [Bacteroidota bacterium]